MQILEKYIFRSFSDISTPNCCRPRNTAKPFILKQIREFKFFTVLKHWGILFCAAGLNQQNAGDSKEIEEKKAAICEKKPIRSEIEELNSSISVCAKSGTGNETLNL